MQYFCLDTVTSEERIIIVLFTKCNGATLFTYFNHIKQYVNLGNILNMTIYPKIILRSPVLSCNREAKNSSQSVKIVNYSIILGY